MNGTGKAFGRKTIQAEPRPGSTFDWLRTAWRANGGRDEEEGPPELGRLEPERAARLIELFEASGRGWFWETDRDGRLVYLSQRVFDKLNLPFEDLAGLPFTSLLAPEEGGSGEGSERSLHFYLSSQAPFAELIVRARAKEETWWSVSGQPITDSVGRFFGFCGIATDLTEHRRSEIELNRLARYDTLTGLANRAMMRRYLEDALWSAERRRQRCAVFLLDLDRFKAVNDTLGHPAGDTLLRLAALRLKEVVGDAGQVGRLGGDEFQVVFPEFESEDMLGELAEQLIARVSEPYTIGGVNVSVGTSVGVVLSDYDDRTPDDLVRDADLALYAAKAAGKGTHRFFVPDMHAEARERQRMEADLRAALGEDQLSLRFQPTVDLESEQVMGFEALIRWNHPERGWVSPTEFIPIAEELGLIGQIGEWVLRTACSEAVKWPSRTKVAVNISPAQFTPALPALIINVLSNCGLPAERLELEITEGVLLKDDDNVRVIIERLKSIGVRLALDDFGTGYSSLGYLLKVPFDKIKIDQTFVRGASIEGNRNAAIIRAVVSLARELRMETTAEGVEAHDELALMKSLGCSMVQGYIYGKPMLAEDAEKLVSADVSAVPDGFVRARPERRRLLRIGTIVVRGKTHRIRLRNISAGGAMIECSGQLNPGDQVELDIAAGEILSAEVRWTRAEQAGLQFAEPIDLNAVTQRPGATQNWEAFAPNYVSSPAYLEGRSEDPLASDRNR